MEKLSLLFSAGSGILFAYNKLYLIWRISYAGYELFASPKSYEDDV
jgi:hypothetical protein